MIFENISVGLGDTLTGFANTFTLTAAEVPEPPLPWLLGVARSGYYAWLERKESATAAKNRLLVEQIRQAVQGKEKVATKEGPEDLKQFGKEE